MELNLLISDFIDYVSALHQPDCQRETIYISKGDNSLITSAFKLVIIREMFSSFHLILCSVAGGRYKNWKRRWFILNDNCLYYFQYTTVGDFWNSF